MNINDELDQLTEKLSQLHDSLNLGGILLQPKLPPMGRLFEKGNDYARRYGIETIAMVCALRHLGCSLKGIAKTMKATGEQPACLLLTTQYVESFEAAFKQMPGWRPSAAALAQVKQSPGSRYQGSMAQAVVDANRLTQQPPQDADDYRKREAETARRRAAAQAGIFPN